MQIKSPVSASVINNNNMKGKPKPTFLFVSFGAEWGLTSVDFLEGKTNSSSSDGHSSSGSGRILTSRNLLLLREKKNAFGRGIRDVLQVDDSQL